MGLSKMSVNLKKIVKKVAKEEKQKHKKSADSRPWALGQKTRAKASLINNPAGLLKGKGNYLSDMMSAVPRILGGLSKGADLVKGVGSLLTGFGDYRERAATGKYIPMAVGDGAGGGPASFVGAAAPRIRHREYLGNVYSSVDFATTAYPIQIGVRTMFPWLSTMADSFQQYRIHGAELYYESTSSNVSATTNTALGTVMMSTLYEVNQPLLRTSVEILNSEYTTSEKPTVNFYHPLECDPKQTTITNLYVRNSFTPQTSFTDLGNFQISTEGMQADGVQVGKLWITYDVELMKPTLPPNTTNYVRWQANNADNSVITGFFMAANTLPVASTWVAAPVVTIVAGPSASHNNALVFPPDNPGQYLVLVAGQSEGSTQYLNILAQPVMSYTGGVGNGQAFWQSYWPQATYTPVNQIWNYINQPIGPSSALEVVNFVGCASINVDGTGGTLNLGTFASPSGPSAGDFNITIIVIQVPPEPLAAKEPLSLDDVRLLLHRISRLEDVAREQAKRIADDDRKSSPTVDTSCTPTTPNPGVASTGAWSLIEKYRGVSLPPLVKPPLAKL
jgi:hypothetical protein